MKIAVVGTGYVGLVTGACLSDLGNNVWCVDVNEEKINALKNGEIPIYEPGLEDLVMNNFKAGTLKFTTKIHQALADSDICFIAVGTPMGEDGSADLHYVLGVAESIGQYMDHHMYIIDKSTVPVGTAQKVRAKVQEELDKRGSSLTFDVISNPEFLKEGTAISDCQRPDRIVIGTDNDNAAKVMKELYLPLVRNNENIIFMDIEFGDTIGFQVARRLSMQDSQLAVVYMTNYEHYITEAFVCRPLGFIRKSHAEDDLQIAGQEIRRFAPALMQPPVGWHARFGCP